MNDYSITQIVVMYHYLYHYHCKDYQKGLIATILSKSIESPYPDKQSGGLFVAVREVSSARRKQRLRVDSP